jgi:adenine-specific DNA-methyltransferase
MKELRHGWASRMIKYLGSKRTLVPLLGHLAAAAEAQTALDLFSGTTRVARAFKQQGIKVTAVDTASYSNVFGQTWLELDSNEFDHEGYEKALNHLNQLPPQAGFFTQKYSEEAHFYQPHNGERVDAIRNAIERDYKNTELYFPLLCSLILAVDRVDSTTGVQAAYLKKWTARSAKPLKLLDPEFIAGRSRFIQGDALAVASQLSEVDLAYLDPPYNQHRYFGNYHIWETLVRWDAPETFGVANKRVDLRDPKNQSAFNSRVTMPKAVEQVVTETKAKTLILSFNNEAWLSLDQLIDICASRGEVRVLDIDFKRYVGAKIGVYNKQGKQVGEPGAGRNIEHLLICGQKNKVDLLHAVGTKLLN